MNRLRVDQDSPNHERGLIDAAWDEAVKLAAGSSRLSRAEIGNAGRAPPFLFDAFPGYELIRESHRGGQGIVYQAMQKSTGRRVAIKATREGLFTSPRDKARFEREVQILGQLQHPHIVAIHDSGHAGGCFYMAMDFIDGPPLDVFVRSMESSKPPRAFVRSVLELFVKVCDAVNAAHLRGVIHRDLKPSNILIDAEGSPRVLDFGLSKWAEPNLTGDSPPAASLNPPSAMTQTGQFVGSMPWASPEQAEGRPERIDIRTDVYSLGVILYEALTGRFPYPVTGGVRETLNHIVHTEPARPRVVRRDIDDDVETIALKCLAKDREHRYQTAGDLAGDIRRYLADEVILARPPGRWYQFRKFARRNRVWVGGAMATLIALTAGLAGTLSYAIRATRERQRADEALAVAVTAQAAERRQHQAAEQKAEELSLALVKVNREAQKARAAQAFVQGVLGAADPFSENPENRPPGVTVHEVLDAAAQRLRTEFADQPDVRAALLETVGRAYNGLGLYDQAVDQLQRCVEIRRQVLGDDHPELATSLLHLATAKRRSPQGIREALKQCDEALAIRRRHLGDGHELTVNAAQIRAQLLWELGEKDATWNAIVEAAVPFLVNFVTEADFPQDIAQTLSRIKTAAADGDKASVKRLILDFRIQGAKDLGDLWARGDRDAAFALIRRHYLPLMKNVFWKSNLPLLLSNLAMFLESQGDGPDVCEPLFREAAWLGTQLSGEHDPLVAYSHERIGLLLHRQRKDLAGAEAELQLALAGYRQQLGEEHPRLARCLSELATVCAEQDRPSVAISFLRKAVELDRASFPGRRAEFADDALRLAALLTNVGEPQEAESLARQALELRRELPSDGAWPVAEAKASLGSCLLAQGRFAEAETWLTEAADALQGEHDGSATSQRRIVAQHLVRLYESWGKPEQVAQWRDAPATSQTARSGPPLPGH